MLEELENSGFRVIDHAFVRGLQGWGVPGVPAPFCRLYYNTEPGATCRVEGGREIALTPEFFYIIPRTRRFYARNEQSLTQFFIHFFVDEHLPASDGDILQVPAEPELLHWVQAYEKIRNDPDAFMRRSLLAEHILSGVLLRLPEELLRPTRKLLPQIARVRSLISKNRGQRRNNDELADVAGFARNSFIRIFTREMGESPQAYCRKKQIELACELLQTTERSIDEIAEYAGFVDRFHLTRVFTRQLGCPPGFFRQQLGTGQANCKPHHRSRKAKG